MKPDFLTLDFNHAPFIAIWEVTQACDLACKHCRAEARPQRHSNELTTSEGFELIRQIRKFGKPLFVITGGDPLYRPDVYDLVKYADELGLRVALTPAGTPKLNADAINRLSVNGLSRLAVSLDGSSRQVHDEFRGVDGSFDWTVRAIRHARGIDLPVQVNTSIGKHNVLDVTRMAGLMEELDICLWSVFFIVPTGRAGRRGIISAPEHEEVFNQLYELSKKMPFDIKTTAGQHYRRVVLQRRMEEKQAGGESNGVEMETGGWAADMSGKMGVSAVSNGTTVPEFLTEKGTAQKDASSMIGRAAKGVNDGNGFVFISHTGEVFPSGFLPLSAGNVRQTPLKELYRDSPLFRACRSYELLQGKCGYCDFRDVCGGSRSRSFGVTGNLFASEPYCVYKPRKPEGYVEPEVPAEFKEFTRALPVLQ